MTIVIRKMIARDRHEWASMRCRLWDNESEAEHMREMAQLIETGKLTGYGAFQNGQAIGFAEVSIRDYANGCTQRPAPFLEGIWIASEHRRRGVARMLLDVIAEDLRADGFSELCSDVDIENQPSRSAHAVWGFQEVETVICYRKPLL